MGPSKTQLAASTKVDAGSFRLLSDRAATRRPKLARFTPIQDEIATFAARAPGRTMAEVARAVGPDRNPRDMRAAINRAARNGRVVLVPNPLFPGSFLVYAGENIGGEQEKVALRAVGRRGVRLGVADTLSWALTLHPGRIEAAEEPRSRPPLPVSPIGVDGDHRPVLPALQARRHRTCIKGPARVAIVSIAWSLPST